MDISEYRRQFEQEIEQAARQPSFRDLVERSGRGAAPHTASAGQAAAAGQAAPADGDLTAATAVLRDDAADEQLRSAALRVISRAVEGQPELIDTLVEVLLDTSRPEAVRLEVLDVLQQISFRMVAFPAKRPDYLAALRSLVDDRSAELRRRAIGILAREKDEYVQRRLIEGLESGSEALVPTEKAIQYLGYDIHAEYFPLLRQIAEKPPTPEARAEAVRLLAADPSSAGLLVTILSNKNESPDVRRLSAIGLQSADPGQFQEHARRIVLDDDEDDQLRATSITALTHFADPEALSRDDELTGRIAQLRAESSSPQVKQATAGYLSRHGT
jgi:hypothetical protein